MNLLPRGEEQSNTDAFHLDVQDFREVVCALEEQELFLPAVRGAFLVGFRVVFVSLRECFDGQRREQGGREKNLLDCHDYLKD